MRKAHYIVWAVGVCLLGVSGVFGQVQRPTRGRAGDESATASRPVEPGSSATGPQAVVPRLMKFNGILLDATGKPLTGTVDVTFSLYNAEAGGSPLWFETQSVQADELGRYTALLGAMHSDGLPIDLFTSGEVRWLGIQVGSEAEQQPRVLLVSVPYALKAGDAETLGGKPASAYMLSETQSGSTATTTSSTGTTNTAQTSSSGKSRKSQSTNKSPVTACSSVTSDGTATANSIALFTTACSLQSANLVQFNGNLGFGTTTPQARLHIFGPDSSDSDARFNFILGDSTPAAVGTGGGILFSGYYSGTTSKAGFANIRGIKENSIQGNYATAMVFDTRANGGNQTERMRISSAGNVGIGTSTPAAKLEVDGTTTNPIVSVTQSGNGNGIIASTVSTTTGTGAIAGTASGNAGGVAGVAGIYSGGAQGAGVFGEATTASGQAGIFRNYAGGPGLRVENSAGTASIFDVESSGTLTLGNGLSSAYITNDGTTTVVHGPLSANGLVTFAGGQGFPGTASLASNIFSGNEVVNATGTALSANGGGTGSIGVMGTSNDIAGGSGAAGYFQNSSGGTILALNDGSTNVISVDSNGLDINRPLVVTPQNDPTTATVLNELAKLNSSGNPVPTSPGDLGGAIGIVVSGAGTEASAPGGAVIAVIGVAGCVFDNTAAKSDYVQISSNSAGECHDSGPIYPPGGQVVGRVVDTSHSPPKVYVFGTEVRQGTGGNCSSSASPAVCGSASAGSVSISSSAASLVVNTTAVTANSQIMLQEDSSLSSKLGVTCLFSGRNFAVTSRTAGTSFTISPITTFANTACLSYVIIN